MANILLVDDNAPLLVTQSQLLVGAGHHVVTAANGKEALHAITAQPFDLVITDVVMPVKDGLEIIAHLQRTNPSCPVIAVSGGSTVEAKDYLARARQLGAVYTLTKPYTAAELLKVVNKVL